MSERGPAGLTLIELMVVVAIVGILSTLAALSFRRDRDTSAVADALGGRMSECTRLAAMGGPIRADVAATGVLARTRLVISPADPDQQLFTLERLVEDPLPADTAQWEQVSDFASGTGIRVVGYRDEAVLTEGLGPAVTLTGSLEIECYPDGTTAARTLYLDDGRSERARVAILPLVGEAVVNRGW